MTPPKDTASDPLARSARAWFKTIQRLSYPGLRWCIGVGALGALAARTLISGDLKFTYALLGLHVAWACVFACFALNGWKIYRTWPKDHRWRDWSLPVVLVAPLLALPSFLVVLGFVMAVVTYPVRTGMDVVIEHDRRYDVAAELIDMYGDQVKAVIPEFEGRAHKRVRIRLNRTTPRSGMFGSIIIRKRGGNKYLSKLAPLRGRDDYPSLAIREREGVYREAVGQCVFPLHKAIPPDYEALLANSLGIRTGTFEGQAVVFGGDWAGPPLSREGEKCHGTFEAYMGKAYAGYAALVYPLLYFRDDLYTVRWEPYRFYDFSWESLMARLQGKPF